MIILEGIVNLDKVQGEILGVTYNEQTGTFTVFIKN